MSFNTIPDNVLTPGVHVEFDSSRAVRGLPGQPHRVLLIGQRLGTGEVAELVVTRVVRVLDAENAFGKASQLSAMVRSFKANNPRTELWAIALDEPAAGVKAKAVVKFTGAAEKDAVLTCYIGGIPVQVAVAKDDTGAEVTEALKDAIVAAGDDLPVVATFDAGAGETTIECRWKGLTGNDLDIRFVYRDGDRLPAGLALAATPAFADGAGSPDVESVIAALGDQQFNTVSSAFGDDANVDALTSWLDERWGGMVQLEGHLFLAARGTHGALTTWAEDKNSRHATTLGAGKSPTPSWVWAAALAGVDSAETDPARPRQTLPILGVLPPVAGDLFTRDERQLLLEAGIATYTVDDGGVCRVERLVTNNLTSEAGAPDSAYRDVETLRTLAYLRWSWRTRMQQRFPRHKLVDDDTRVAPGQPVVSPRMIRAETIALFTEWERAAFAESIEQFKADLVVQRPQNDTERVDVFQSPDLVNQFRVAASQIAFLK